MQKSGVRIIIRTLLNILGNVRSRASQKRVPIVLKLCNFTVVLQPVNLKGSAMNISNFAYALLAQAETTTTNPTGSAGSEAMSWILMIVLFFFIMWFFMIRPQQSQQKKFDQLINGLKVGDKVVTIGGVKASISNIIRGSNNETLEIQLLLDDKNNVKVMFDPRAIAYVVTPEEDKKK